MNETDIKTQLCKYVFWQHNSGVKKLSARQMGSPWQWIFKTQPGMKNGETVTEYQLRGVKIPEDGENPSYTFMLDDIKL
jgi:hypothetical protein